MNSTSPRTLDPKTLSETQDMLANRSDIQQVIAFMRARGFSKIDSIKTLRDLTGMPLHEGKALVHLSPAWADRYASDEAFHDAAEEAAKIIFQEEFTAA